MWLVERSFRTSRIRDACSRRLLDSKRESLMVVNSSGERQLTILSVSYLVGSINVSGGRPPRDFGSRASARTSPALAANLFTQASSSSVLIRITRHNTGCPYRQLNVKRTIVEDRNDRWCRLRRGSVVSHLHLRMLC